MPTEPALIGPALGSSVHVMSYNLRVIGDVSPNTWQERRAGVGELLNLEQPSVLGIQEGMYPQVRDVAAALPDRYDWIGLGRGGGSHEEFNACFFDTERVEPLEYDHRWHSDTPLVVGSSSWGNKVVRMLTWVRFADRRTGVEFVHLNTHLDHETEAARRGGAELIRAVLAEIAPTGPVVVTGDFNARPGSEPYRILTEDAGLIDTWDAAEKRLTPAYSSFTGWRPASVGEHRIDWILVREGTTTHEAGINPCEGADPRPSDHLPVQVSLDFPALPAST